MKYYSFFSYKHSETNGKFKADAHWSKMLSEKLDRLTIPTDKEYDDRFFINTNPKDKKVHPVFRDEKNMGYVPDLPQALKDALDASRTLVIIISKEMLADQRNKDSKGEKAWCFEEIRYFKKLNRDADDFILVYIDPEEITDVKDIVPDPLKDVLIVPRPICVNAYTHDTGKTLADSKMEKEAAEKTAAAIASHIFHAFDTEDFWSLKLQEEKKNKRKKLFIWLCFVILSALILFAANLAKESYVKNLIDHAVTAYEKGNAIESIQYAEKAYSWDCHSDETKSLLIKTATIDYTKPLISGQNGYLAYSTVSHEFFEYDDKSHTVFIRDHKYKKTGESFSASGDLASYYSSSADKKLLLVPEKDSIYVYNRIQRRFIFSTPYNRARFDDIGKTVFDKSGEKVARVRRNDVLIHDLVHHQTVTIPESYDQIFSRDSSICLERMNGDTLCVDRVDLHTSVILPLNRWSLPSGTSSAIQETLSVSPDGKVFLAWTGSEVICIYKDGITSLMSSDIRPYFSYSEALDRFAIYFCEGKNYHVDVYKGLAFDYSFYWQPCNVDGVSWGKNDDLIVDYGDAVCVYNPQTKTQVILDATMCRKADFSCQRIFEYDDDYLLLLHGDFAIDYALYRYPDQNWTLNPGAYPENNVGSINYIGECFDLPNNRSLICWENHLQLFSTDNRSLIADISYPFAASASSSMIGMNKIAMEGNRVFCNFAEDEVTDSGALLWNTHILSVNTLSDSIESLFFRKGLYHLVSNDKDILIAERGDRGSIIKLDSENLTPVDSLFIGEYIMIQPVQCADGSYLTITDQNNLYRFSFKNRKVQRVSIPLRANDISHIFESRYVEMYEENGDGSYVYDLNTNQIVLFLLPDEHLLSIEDGCAFIWYSNHFDSDKYHYSQQLYYSRVLLFNHDIQKSLAVNANDWG